MTEQAALNGQHLDGVALGSSHGTLAEAAANPDFAQYFPAYADDTVAQKLTLVIHSATLVDA